jgi:hypothetical protein
LEPCCRNPVLIALVAGGAIVGLAIGVLLITRPGPSIVRWSNVAGVAWLIAFGPLVLTRLDKPGPLVSSVLITSLGVAGALVPTSVARRRPDSNGGPAPALSLRVIWVALDTNVS